MNTMDYYKGFTLDYRTEVDKGPAKFAKLDI